MQIETVIDQGGSYLVNESIAVPKSSPGWMLQAVNQWIDDGNTPDYPLREAVERAKAEVDQLRDKKIASGLTYAFPDSEGTIQLRSQQDFANILGIASAGQALTAIGDDETLIYFRDAENVSHPLKGIEAVQMGLAVQDFVSSHYAAAWAHKDALNTENPETYDINEGWPV
tara:strand:+ start:15666 stop:16178 length:513 start_codon:yes stop_codon:yes gene_type:complete